MENYVNIDLALEQRTVRKYEPVVAVKTTGIYDQWGYQAWFDLVMVRWLLNYAGDIVEKTYIPIIKLSSDNPKEVDAAFELLQQQNETVRWYDSPREKWRKEYGNFVREYEWACEQLYKYFSKREYQELLTSTVADVVKRWLRGLLPKINQWLASDVKEHEGGVVNKISDETAKTIVSKSFRFLNFASFMVGECHVDSFRLKDRTMVMKIPDCGFHTASRMAEIPDQGCVFACKGGCERAFDEASTVKLYFEPHLPDTSCTLTISW